MRYLFTQPQIICSLLSLSVNVTMVSYCVLCKIVLHLPVMTTLCHPESVAQCVLCRASCPMEHLFHMAPIINLTHAHFGESEFPYLLANQLLA